MVDKYIHEDIIYLMDDIFKSEAEFKEVRIKFYITISTAQFNKVKEYLLRFTKSYKVYKRKYKDNDTMVIYHKFIFKSLIKITITTIQKNNTDFIDIKEIKIILK